jgi:predicted transporter
MKSVINILGILLLVGGIITLAYQGFTYTKQEQIAKIGEITVTAEQPKTIYIPPILSGLCILSGLILIVVARK